jgi:hypothetical protein
MLDIVLVCRRSRHLPPMRVQIFTPNLEPVISIQTFSRKITKRYLLKPIIPIITYNHSMLQRTTSKRRVHVHLITTQFVFFPLLIVVNGYFSSLILTLFWSTGDRGSCRRLRPNIHSNLKLGASQSFSRKISQDSATPRPMERGELTAAPPSRPRPRHGSAPGTPRPTERGELTAAFPSRQRPRHGRVPGTPPSTTPRA